MLTVDLVFSPVFFLSRFGGGGWGGGGEGGQGSILSFFCYCFLARQFEM